MKLFLIKFCALFSIIYLFVGIYEYSIKPNLSGDIGKLGQIPFGNEYTTKLHNTFNLYQKQIYNYGNNEYITDSIIIIGDSFSQQGCYGYSQFMADKLQSNVLNIYDNNHHVPEQSFIKLINNHQIPENAIVIIESNERAIISRLTSLNFADTSMFVVQPIPKKEHINLLSRTIMWLKYNVLRNSPILEFQTSKELFSHDKIHKEIYIYYEDLKFINKITMSMYNKAWDNLYKLKMFSDEHNVRMVYLIASDKYDIYEPFILDAPLKNMTMEYIPKENWIVNSKPILQKAVYRNVKDVYYLNDTHWSPVGSKIVGDEIADRIKSLCEE